MKTKAIYEAGVLKPLGKLDLNEGAEVEIELEERKVFGGKRNILRYAGILKDLNEEEKKMFEESVKRRSLFGRTLKQ
ncbi:putative DNA-binding protein [Candidatus Methanophagaceae archaeon]|nr:putative DNA-binding protein [Methanophagales archaeon]